jgi:peroxiredoxin
MVEILLRTDSIPDLVLRASRDSDSVSVETWGDELVLVLGDQFKSAGVRFGEKDRMAHLRVAWDRPAGHCALYGPDGKVWAQIAPEKKEVVPEKEGELKPVGSWLRRLFGEEESDPASKRQSYGRGVSLMNKGSSIIIERFWVSDWSGDAPPPVPGEGACVETAGEVISGEPAGRNGDALTLRLADGKTRDVALAGVRAIRFPLTANLERDPAVTDLWFADGSLLHGKVTQVKDGKVSVETSFATAPVLASLDHCRAVVMPEPEKKSDAGPSLDKLDVISDGEYTLHGNLQTSGGILPRFQPVGAVEALTPAESKKLTITRSVPADGRFERAPALLHVKTGETLPVTLKGVTREKIDFAWDAADAHDIDTSKVHAIQFAAPAIMNAGFDGSGWQVLGTSGKNASRKGGMITLQPGAGIGHPYLLQGGDISFNMTRVSGFSSLRIKLFCQGTDRTSQSLNFLLGDFGSEVYCGVERSEGQMDSQTEIPSKGSTNEVRISFPGDQVEMYVNGVRAASASAKSKTGKKSGTGIILETASLWGNQVGPIKVSAFSTQTSSCLAGPPAYSDDARREALLLPRMRRDDPPRQVLIGRNGDLLRGEIEAMTSTHLSFRAGMETFKVPLDRVAAAVWVKKPDKTAPKEDADKKTASDSGDEGGKPQAKAGLRLAIAQKLAGLFAGNAAAPEKAQAMEAKPLPPGVRIASTAPGDKKDEKKDGKEEKGVQWLDLTNGGRLGLTVESWSGDKVTGQHPLLGHCSIPSSLVYRLSIKAPAPAGALAALADWALVNTPDPVLPEDEGTSSPLAGKPGADFKLPMLEGADFALSNNRGKVVVLDFWATWCGPCVKSLPGLVEAMAEFPADKAMLVTVNQGETKDQVKKFIEARNLKMAVAMDGDQAVAKKYGVEGIPHTVVIAPDGKVAFVKTGYEPDGDKKIAEAVRKALPDAPAEKKEEDKPKDEDKPKEAKAPEAPAGEPLLPAPKLN